MNAGEAEFIEAFGLDQCERDVTLQARVAREIDAFARAFAEEALDLVATAGERGRKGCFGDTGLFQGAAARVAEARACARLAPAGCTRTCDESPRVTVPFDGSISRPSVRPVGDDRVEPIAEDRALEFGGWTRRRGLAMMEALDETVS